MIIAQITDLHVLDRDRVAYGRVDTNAQLREAVAHLARLDPRPDVVVATGDLTDHGTPSEYAVLREILSPLAMPVYLLPGNHDRRDAFLEAFRDHAYLPRPGAPFAHYAVDDHPVRLVGLDTTVAGDHHGVMCAERLAWLDATLAARPGRPTAIFMHHPPFRTGIRWMDAAGLHGGRQMAEVVARHPQVVRVACGHLHRPIQVAWAGTVACTMPSTCHQVALNLTDRGGYDFVTEPRAVQLHVWDEAYGLVSHLSYVPDGHEVFRPEFRNRPLDGIVEMAHRRYEALCRTEYEAGPGGPPGRPG